MDATEFGKLTGVPLGDIFETSGSMNIDVNGYLATGETSGSLGPLGASERQTAVWIPFEGVRSAYLKTSGYLRVASVLYVQGEAKSLRPGFAIDGKLASTKLDIGVGAKIGPNPNGALCVQGTMTVPPQFQSDFNKTIQDGGGDGAAGGRAAIRCISAGHRRTTSLN